MTDAVPPVSIFVVGALLLPFIPKRLKSVWLLLDSRDRFSEPDGT